MINYNDARMILINDQRYNLRIGNVFMIGSGLNGNWQVNQVAEIMEPSTPIKNTAEQHTFKKSILAAVKNCSPNNEEIRLLDFD